MEWLVLVYIVLGFIMIFSIINRICECIEKCNANNAMVNYMQNSETTGKYNGEYKKFSTKKEDCEYGEEG